MESMRRKSFVIPISTVVAVTILVFVPQVLVFPLFLDSSNVAKALFFCFLFFLMFVISSPRRLNLVLADLFWPFILLVPVFSTFFSSSHSYPLVSSLLLISLILYRFTSEELFRSHIDLAALFLRAFSCFVLVVALLGIYEFFSFFLCGKSTLPLIPYLLPPDLSYRVAGIYGQPNFTALLLLTGLLVYFYAYLHDKVFETVWLYRLRYLPFLAVAVAFFLTGSRAGQLALALTVLPLCWLVIRRCYLRDKPVQRRQFFVLCALLVGAFVIAYALNLGFSVQGTRALSSTGISTDTRFVLWTAAVLMFFDHPWLGIGLENYKFFLPKYVNSAHDLLGFVEYEAMSYTAWAHNEFLQLSCEGGIIVMIALIGVVVCLLYPLFMYFRGERNWPPLKLYSHIFLVPFVIQSMFSWPMRYAPLLILFFSFGALLLSQYRGVCVTLSEIQRNGIRILAVCCLFLTLFASSQELRMGSLVKDVKVNGPQNSFSEFEELASRGYTEYPLLMKMVPQYVRAAVYNKDAVFAEQILPYVKRLTELHGAHWQWSYLAHVYLLLNRRDDAMVAVTKAIELWPPKEEHWRFQHYLNMLKASERTGRTVDDFLPLQPGQSAEDLKEIFDFADRIKIYK